MGLSAVFRMTKGALTLFLILLFANVNEQNASHFADASGPNTSIREPAFCSSVSLVLIYCHFFKFNLLLTLFNKEIAVSEEVEVPW